MPINNLYTTLLGNRNSSKNDTRDLDYTRKLISQNKEMNKNNAREISRIVLKSNLSDPKNSELRDNLVKICKKNWLIFSNQKDENFVFLWKIAKEEAKLSIVKYGAKESRTEDLVFALSQPKCGLEAAKELIHRLYEKNEKEVVFKHLDAISRYPNEAKRILDIEANSLDNLYSVCRLVACERIPLAHNFRDFSDGEAIFYKFLSESISSAVYVIALGWDRKYENHRVLRECSLLDPKQTSIMMENHLRDKMDVGLNSSNLKDQKIAQRLKNELPEPEPDLSNLTEIERKLVHYIQNQN